MIPIAREEAKSIHTKYNNITNQAEQTDGLKIKKELAKRSRLQADIRRCLSIDAFFKKFNAFTSAEEQEPQWYIDECQKLMNHFARINAYVEISDARKQEINMALNRLYQQYTR